MFVARACTCQPTSASAAVAGCRLMRWDLGRLAAFQGAPSHPVNISHLCRLRDYHHD